MAYCIFVTHKEVEFNPETDEYEVVNGETEFFERSDTDISTAAGAADYLNYTERSGSSDEELEFEDDYPVYFVGGNCSKCAADCVGKATP